MTVAGVGTGRLQGLGVALLLALADPTLRPPKPEKGIPGVRCVEPDLTGALVHLQAVGYDRECLASQALGRARRILEDANMRVTKVAKRGHHPLLAVSRRH